MLRLFCLALTAAATAALIGFPWLRPQWSAVELVGLVLLFWFTGFELRRTRAASFIGFLIGGTALGIAFHWAIESIDLTTNLTGWKAVLAWLALVAWEGIPFAIVIAVFRRFQGISACLAASATWALCELYWPKIFPWSFAHPFLEWLPVVQLASVFGQTGVAAYIILLVTLLASLVDLGITRWAHRRVSDSELSSDSEEASSRRQRTLVLSGFSGIATLLFLVAVPLWGSFRTSQLRARVQDHETLRIAAIQVDPSWLGAIEKLSARSNAVADSVDLICWPESTLGYFHQHLDTFEDPVRVQQMAMLPTSAVDPWPQISKPLLAGAKCFPRVADEGPYQNLAYLIEPSKKIRGRYVKQSLMPIGEYMPMEEYFPFLRRWAALGERLDRGDSSRPIVLRDQVRLGMMICYEDMVATGAQKAVDEGAGVLVALINASHFPSPYTLSQHERLSRFRAVETSRWMVRCAATGRTCIIAPDGRVAAAVPLATEGTLTGEVEIRGERTPFVAFPHALALLAAAVLGCVYLRDPTLPGCGKKTGR